MFSGKKLSEKVAILINGYFSKREDIDITKLIELWEDSKLQILSDKKVKKDFSLIQSKIKIYGKILYTENTCLNKLLTLDGQFLINGQFWMLLCHMVYGEMKLGIDTSWTKLSMMNIHKKILTTALLKSTHKIFNLLKEEVNLNLKSTDLLDFTQELLFMKENNSTSRNSTLKLLFWPDKIWLDMNQI